MVRGGKLFQMARMWHKMAITSRRILSSTSEPEKGSAEKCGKGKFAVYSRDGSRFVIPLTYLDSSIFRELLLMSEEEFGLSNAGPIVIPCDASLLAHVISLLKRRNSQEAHRVIIAAISGNRCSSSHSIPQGMDLWQSAVSVH